MAHFDLCLTWYWEYDFDFVRYVEHACYIHGVSFWEVSPDNLLDATTGLYQGEQAFTALLDRSQGDTRFEPLHQWARAHGVRRINPAELSSWSEDKATMHLELISNGIYTPYTIVIPPFIQQPILPPVDFSPLGDYFVIKPSNGGGGEGVVLGASQIDHIRRARMEYPEQKYLVQAYISPSLLQEKPAWFRVFYAGGDVFPCWWHPSTHVYTILTKEEEIGFNLEMLREVTLRLASICRLDWFSTEIACADQQFVVVDYVNDQIDMRAQSKAVDGVPDEIIQKIAERLVLLTRLE